MELGKAPRNFSQNMAQKLYSERGTRTELTQWFKKSRLTAGAIARAIAYAIEQPVQVEVDEMVIRPTVQDF